MFAAPRLYRDYRATDGLTPERIAAIRIQPNGDWPVVTLDSRNDISAFIQWLDSTRDTSRLRSAPPPMVFDGAIHYRDGSTESFRTSAMMEPLTDTDGMDGPVMWELNLHGPRGDVLINLIERSLTRSGERKPLSHLIENAK